MTQESDTPLPLPGLLSLINHWRFVRGGFCIFSSGTPNILCTSFQGPSREVDICTGNQLDHPLSYSTIKYSPDAGPATGRSRIYRSSPVSELYCISDDGSYLENHRIFSRDTVSNFLNLLLC